MHSSTIAPADDAAAVTANFLRDFSSADKPTILTLNGYGTCKRLVESFYAHSHDKIVDNMRKDRWAKTTDRGNWSKLKRLHMRVDDRMLQECGSCDAAEAMGRNSKGILVAKIQAAAWLDQHERASMTLARYEKFLANPNNFEGAYAPARKRQRR